MPNAGERPGRIGLRARTAALTATVLAALPPAGLAARTAGCAQAYERRGMVRDFALGAAWVVLASCQHPERPRIAVELGGREPEQGSDPAVEARSLSGDSKSFDAMVTPSQPHAAANARVGNSQQAASEMLPPFAPRAKAAVREAPPLIAAGDRVRLWRQDRLVAIDLDGVALEGGTAGTAIRVRVGTGKQVLRGTVRASGSVELEAATAGFSDAPR